MRIDLVKLIYDLLPPRLRLPVLTEYVRVHLMEIAQSQNHFEQLSPDMEYRANANASVLSIQHRINREFDVNATITELDGKPFDFLVSVIGNVDENKLKVLIDESKLAGKSYVFRLGDVNYSAAFINYDCEDIRENWTAEFSEYECEQAREIKLHSVPMIDNNSLFVRITATNTVTSDIVVFGVCQGWARGGSDNDGAVLTIPFYGKIENNTAGVDILALSEIHGDYVYTSYIEYISPLSDDYYDYIINN